MTGNVAAAPPSALAAASIIGQTGAGHELEEGGVQVSLTSINSFSRRLLIYPINYDREIHHRLAVVSNVAGRE